MLIVGQGSPGGIATFIGQVTSDEWLRAHVDIDHLNTTLPPGQRPGALSPTNVREALRHTWGVYRRARHADVVHLNMAAAPLLPLTRALMFTLAARASRANVVLHAHTGLIGRSLASPLYRRLLRLVARLVSILVVVSREGEEQVRRVASNVVRIGNGVDVDAFKTGPKSDEQPALLFLGTVCERKGLLDLRDALVDVRDRHGRLPLHVLIAGDGKQEGPGAFERVKRAFAGAGLGADVTFLGEITAERVPELFAQADIFCLPSHLEGSPIAVLEAMASEAAVVGSDVGDIPLMLDEGRAGVVFAAHDVTALASSIDRLTLDPEERARLGRIARDRAGSEFGLRRVTAALLDLYTSLGRRAG